MYEAFSLVDNTRFHSAVPLLTLVCFVFVEDGVYLDTTIHYVTELHLPLGQIKRLVKLISRMNK